MADNPRSWREVGRVFLLIILAVIVAVCYNALDANGWIPHSFKGQIYFPSHGWEVGEYVFCEINQPKETEKVGPMLGCNNEDFTGTIRVMDVKVWGLVKQDVQAYQCRRNEDSFSCHLP